MLVTSLILLAAIVAATALGMHLGPHGLMASGAAGVIVSAVLIVDVVFLASAASPGLSLGLFVVATLISATVFVSGIRALRRSNRLASANPTTKLLSAHGIAITDLTPCGTIRVLGETWSAESLSGSVKAGAEVYVSDLDGLRLKVWANPELSQNFDQENRA